VQSLFGCRYPRHLGVASKVFNSIQPWKIAGCARKHPSYLLLKDIERKIVIVNSLLLTVEISRIILSSMENVITTMEAQAEELGETDKALTMCDTAISLCNWYHAYLAGKEVNHLVEREREGEGERERERWWEVGQGEERGREGRRGESEIKKEGKRKEEGRRQKEGV
jgi:hypothetical protein